MSKFMENGLFKLISSLVRPNEGVRGAEQKPDIGKQHQAQGTYQPELARKVWKKEYNPLRQIILWGWDEKNNPGLLILYGRHQFAKNEDQGGAVRYILEDHVTYTSYAVFKGKGGHLPSFEAVRIIEESEYMHQSLKNVELPAMYFKKGLKYYWSWQADSSCIVKDFKNLKPAQQISFPYFVPQSYSECVQRVQKANIQLNGFRLAKSPQEVLKLVGEIGEPFKIMIELMSSPNIYKRKKKLEEFLAANPSKQIFLRILEMGSSELISGLFLELAKRENPILLEEAKRLMESEINWAEGSYAKGVKRCVQIYLNALDEATKAERIEWIRQSLSQMDLNIIRMNNRDIPPDKRIEGAVYRKYAACGQLADYYWRYDYETRRSIRHQSPKRYQEGPYTDGRILKRIVFKNTLQEAEVYGLADVIGKIAYYLDAPRMTYYFKGSERTKEFKYFRRYIRRTIDGYAKHDPNKFIEAMKSLLTSYTSYDYVCKFKGNFQFNEFIKYYLYHDFTEKPPIGWENSYERWMWMSEDQLMKLEGRYESMKEIWDNHLEAAAEIAVKAQINLVIKACYYILKDSPNIENFITHITDQQLIQLALVSYKPLADWFMNILQDKLQQLNAFDVQLMMALIGAGNPEMDEMARAFFKKTNGRFSASETADLLLLDNLDNYMELFKESLFALGTAQYVSFVKGIINHTERFKELGSNPSESILALLEASTDKMVQLSASEKQEVISELILKLKGGEKLPKWITTFIEEVVFSFAYNDFDGLLNEITFEPLQKSIPKANKQMLSVLEAIKNKTIPSDAQIISILETGTSKMISTLFQLISENDAALSSRFSTLLILFESEINTLNQKAEDLFGSMKEEDQKKLHALLIDSPVPRAYLFGLKQLDVIYGDLIPEAFIIQMLEHSSPEVKAYISDKMNKVLNYFESGNENLFMYYVRTLLLLPNKVSKSKDSVYEVIPKFAAKHQEKSEELERLLMDVGASNIIKDSERALVALAKVRKGAEALEG